MADMKRRGIAFEQRDAAGDLAARAEMRRLSGGLKVPTVLHPDGTVSVGFDGY